MLKIERLLVYVQDFDIIRLLIILLVDVQDYISI